MAFMITQPTSAFNGDVTQKRLGTTTKKETVLVASTAANLVVADGTATLGRKLLALNNTSSTDSVKVALGRTASATDYDFILPANSQIVDMDWNTELISGFSTGTPTIISLTVKFEEI